LPFVHFVCSCLVFVVCSFFLQPLKPRVREDWETIWWGGWIASAAAFFFVAAYAPNTSLRHWAREEALHSGFKVPDVAPDLD
jgi:hypothetical protein